MAATTTGRRRTIDPITKAWNVAKKLDANQKLQLVTMLVESVRPAIEREQSDSYVDFADMDKEFYTPEEAFELTMKDIKAVYEDAAV